MMNETGLISVIVPIYNREYSLDYCLMSIQKQTYGRWECILVDDGSTDRSLVMCEEFVREDSRFRVFSQTNRGASAARNRGIFESHGEYLAFVDSDDWLDPCYLQKLYELITCCDMPVCGMQLADRDGKELCTHFKEEAIYKLNDDATALLSETIENGLILSPACKLFSKCIIEEHQLSFKEGLQWGEDALFACEYLKYCCSLGFISELLYHVVKHSDSLSSKARYDIHFFESGLLVWNSIRDLFVAHRINNEKAIGFINNYYYITITNGLGCVQHWHDKLTAKERFIHIRNILSGADRERLKSFLCQNPRQIKAWLIYLKLKAGLWILYELIYFIKGK